MNNSQIISTAMAQSATDLGCAPEDFIKDKNIIDLTFLSSLLAFSLNGLTDCNFVGHNLKELTYMFYFITGMYLACKKYIINKN